MPHVDDGAGDGRAGGVADLALHEQHLALLRILVQPRLALLQRRVCDVERPFDGARRAALEAGAALLLVHDDVEEGLDAEPGDQQPDLVGLAEPGEVAARGPELGRRDVELLDDAAHVGRDPVDDALQSRVPAGLVEPGRAVQQLLDLGGVGQGLGHSFPPFRPRAGVSWFCRMRSGRRSAQPRSPPATGRVTPVMYEASSEARNRIAAACSSVVP